MLTHRRMAIILILICPAPFAWVLVSNTKRIFRNDQQRIVERDYRFIEDLRYWGYITVVKTDLEVPATYQISVHHIGCFPNWDLPGKPRYLEPREMVEALNNWTYRALAEEMSNQRKNHGLRVNPRTGKVRMRYTKSVVLKEGDTVDQDKVERLTSEGLHPQLEIRSSNRSFSATSEVESDTYWMMCDQVSNFMCMVAPVQDFGRRYFDYELNYELALTR